jgi:hypothetical protein
MDFIGDLFSATIFFIIVAVDEYVQGGAINREINCFFLLQCKDLHLLLKLMVALESTGWYTFCWGIAYTVYSI